jgi:hypothetical protein
MSLTSIPPDPIFDVHPVAAAPSLRDPTPQRRGRANGDAARCRAAHDQPYGRLTHLRFIKPLFTRGREIHSALPNWVMVSKI